MKPVLFVGGATGGHLQPAMSIAHALANECGLEPHFLVGDRDIEERIMAASPFASHRVPGFSRSWSAVRRLRRAAAGLLAELEPGAVVGLGGGASVVPGWCAWRRGIPLFLHEQNRIVGRANRWLYPLARRLFLSYADTRRGGLLASRPLRRNVLRLGCPVRPSFAADEPPTSPMTVLVLGGSQGAEPVNRLVTRALPILARRAAERVEPLRFVHVSGPGKVSDLVEQYSAHGIDAEVLEYVGDPAPIFRRSSFIIARAGGSTVAEISAVGRAALLLPYLHHRDRQQFLNAGALVERGAAEILEENPELLAARVMEWANDPGKLVDMGARARTLATPGCASRIAEVIATHLECAPLGAEGIAA